MARRPVSAFWSTAFLLLPAGNTWMSGYLHISPISLWNGAFGASNIVPLKRIFFLYCGGFAKLDASFIAEADTVYSCTWCFKWSHVPLSMTLLEPRSCLGCCLDRRNLLCILLRCQSYVTSLHWNSNNLLLMNSFYYENPSIILWGSWQLIYCYGKGGRACLQRSLADTKIRLKQTYPKHVKFPMFLQILLIKNRETCHLPRALNI